MSAHRLPLIPDGIAPGDGCDIAPHCLECPLPACRYELPNKAAWALVHEARVRELHAAGHSRREIATIMGVAARSVDRWMVQTVTRRVAEGKR